MTQTELNFAEVARDQGIQSALEHAGTSWVDQAFHLIKTFLTIHHRPFLAEEFRDYATRYLEEPPHVNAWGGLIKKAQAAGLIRFHSYEKTTSRKAHRRVAAMWVGAC